MKTEEIVKELRGLLEDGTGKIKAATMYRALRLAGPFRKKTKGKA